jgi:NADPH:quinone reductase-like Zn-dependent oxidoreductase
MKAAVKTSASAPVQYGDFAEPVVDPGRQLVDLVAAGIHPVVRAIADGKHYGSSDGYPLVAGVDAVAKTADGRLVYTGYAEAPYGTLAERIAVPAAMGFELPAVADPVAVAGGLNPGISSWMPLLTRKAEVGQLGTVLVLGATGVAGNLAVQNALHLGASLVVAAGRSAQGLALAREAGAATVALTGEVDADAVAITAALAGHTPTLVLDFVWGRPAEAAFVALGRSGLDEDDADISYVEIGATAGAAASVPASLLRSRHIAISGSGAGSASISDIMRQLPRYINLIADGTVRVPTLTYPLSRVSEAWAESSSSRHRVVVVPG